MPLPRPQYSIWNALSAALALSLRAIDEVRELARLPGPKGEQGERGKDGFSLADVTVESPDGGRTVLYGFKTDKSQIVREIKTWAIIDRGVYRAEQEYERGDYVSWDGSGWVSQGCFIGVKPGDASGAWRLSTKRGRNGKDGEPGPQGDKGEPGRNGRDLAQMVRPGDGGKW